MGSSSRRDSLAANPPLPASNRLDRAAFGGRLGGRGGVGGSRHRPAGGFRTTRTTRRPRATL
ncbi:MAG: hypothetical protein CMJ52_06160 [Planctomycetaceae bacterium]|nr:hypothetical protein [Planctomycetaceae bacterium]